MNVSNTQLFCLLYLCYFILLNRIEKKKSNTVPKTCNSIFNFCTKHTQNKNRVGRLLERGKDSGRVDDNIEVIRKRFKTHQESTVPILTYFGKQNIPLHTIDSAKMVEQVYDSVEQLFR